MHRRRQPSASFIFPADQFVRMQSLLPRVAELFAEAEGSLGVRLEIREEPALAVTGTTAVIPGRRNYGKILFSPKYSDCLDYVIANQCCHILRYTRAPPEHRLVPIDRNGAYARVYSLLLENAASTELKTLPAAAMRELARLLLTGLVSQVTNIPADCRIDRWLHSEVPELRDEQRRALDRMLTLYLKSLADDVQRWTPAPIYRASNAMNGAFARNCESLFPELALFSSRYSTKEFQQTTDAFWRHLDGEDEGYISDIATTDAWATDLGIRDLYEWRHERELKAKAVG